MDQATINAIYGAAGGLIIACLTYLAGYVRAQAAAQKAKEAAAAAAQAAGAKRRASDQAGGGAAVPVRPAPAWNQLADPISTGVLPDQRYNECGEECCAEIIYQQHGVEVSADALRAQIHGYQGAALTSGQDLVKLLARNNVAAQLHFWPVGEAPAHIQESAAAGRAVIILGRWVSPTVLHWVLVTAATAAELHYNDPWGGLRLSIPWVTFAERYGAQLVTVTRTPDGA